ncbi:MAG: NfeD family protein [Oscillospiraceae bacterium]|nr:NfeD family protein [Oscillospiraceae bacterium]
METLSIIWLILAGVFFIAEIFTLGFFICWLGVGALLAMVVSFFTDSIIIQIVVFVISSIILIFSTKPLVKRFVDRKTIPTNKDSLIGKKGLVIHQIDPIKSKGQVKLNGEVWSAKSKDNTVIEVGKEVEVEEVIGVKLVVK